MVCGVCHREPSDHTESSSGPTRCQYKTHREGCPGGFRTKCDQESSEEVEKTEIKSDDTSVEKLAESLRGLDLSSSSTESQDLVWKLQQILNQNNSPGVQSSLPPTVPPAQDAVSPANSDGDKADILTAISHLLRTPTPAVDTSQPSPAAQPPLLPTQEPRTSTFPGLEQLASQHVASNQPFLEKTRHEASYNGPNINEIRRDKATRDQVSQVIEALKQISPVFGQTSSQTVQPVPGISPLDQLKQQLGVQTLAPEPEPLYDPLRQLHQLLSQGQHSVQPMLGNYQPHQQPALYAHQPPLHQQLLPAHIQ